LINSANQSRAIQRPKPIASVTAAICVRDFAVEAQVNQHVIVLLAENRRTLRRLAELVVQSIRRVS
jgi:hypothetical protein